MRLSGVSLVLLLGFGVPAVEAATFAWDYPKAHQAGTEYELHIEWRQQGLVSDRLVKTLAATQCRQDAVAQWTPDTLCTEVCFPPGAYAFSLRARKAGQAWTVYTNTLSTTLLRTSGCDTTPVPTTGWNVKVAFDYDQSKQQGTLYEARLTVQQPGKLPTASDRMVLPLPLSQCRPEDDPAWTPDTLCSGFCVPPGSYSVKVRARGSAMPQWTAYSNEDDFQIDVTTTCGTPPVATTPPPAKGGSGTPAQVGGAAVGAGLGAALARGPSMPSFVEMVNRQCVQWTVTGPCLCNPLTPCVRVEYWEPGWVVETVKIPGTTAIPLLGDVLAGVLAAAGVPPLGGGGAGNAGGSGHTNKQYNEVHILPFPQLLGGPCTACAPRSLPLTIHYASEIDAATWRTAVAPPTPVDLIRQLGVWGPLYPRGGTAIHGSEPVGSGMAAARALDILRQPIGTPPHVEVHAVLQPDPTATTCLQMAYPRQTSCMPAGTPPPLWEHGSVSPRGTYVWLAWRKRTCCVPPNLTTCGLTLPGVGGHGQNMCLIP